MAWWNPLSWTVPQWVKNVLNVIWDILKSILIQVGKEALGKIKAKIIEVNSQNISNEKKFQIVYDYAKSLIPNMKESALNLLIESLVNQLKSREEI